MIYSKFKAYNQLDNLLLQKSTYTIPFHSSDDFSMQLHGAGAIFLFPVDLSNARK